ncbi:hypothetical protein IGK74_002420 [Enterococcus sp. AZ150]|uniref:helix-turn-helix domain-containing protein n=1 Tax=Enterococcus sp. AZ150 TaxID=2774866 RepID=UPI003F20A79D
MEQQRSFYAIIPANVRYDTDLIPSAKLLYGEITALCNERGYCWASNDYFSKQYGVSKPTIQNWLKSLEDKGYIFREVKYKEGSKEIDHRYIRILGGGHQENLVGGHQEIYQDNTTSINNTFNNTSNNQKTSKTRKRVYDENSPYRKIAEFLLKRILDNQKIKDPNINDWSDTIRLMIERDNREGKEVQEVIKWATQDDFWQGVVLSAKSLRKNFDTLAVQKNKRRNSNGQKQLENTGSSDYDDLGW